jgi:hypothetical protein
MCDRLLGETPDPFVATDYEVSHDRDISWTLRVQRALEHIREVWVGTSWIVEGCHGTGEMATQRNSALSLLRLAGFKSILAGLQAVMLYITALLAVHGAELF